MIILSFSMTLGMQAYPDLGVSKDLLRFKYHYLDNPLDMRNLNEACSQANAGEADWVYCRYLTARSFLAVGDSREANKVLKEIEEIRNPQLSLALTALLHSIRGNLLEKRLKKEESLAENLKALKLARQLNDQWLIAYTLNELSWFYSRNFDDLKANEALKEAYSTVTKLNDKVLYYEITNNMGLASSIYSKLGTANEGIKSLKEAYGFFKDIGYKFSAGTLAYNLGIALSGIDNQESLKYHKICLELSETLNDKSGVAYANHGIGLTILEMIKKDPNDSLAKEGISHFQEALGIFIELEDRSYQIDVLYNLLDLQIDSNHLKEAKPTIEKLRKFVEESGSDYDKYQFYENEYLYQKGLGLDYQESLEKAFNAYHDYKIENDNEKISQLNVDMRMNEKIYKNQLLEATNKIKTQEIEDQKNRLILISVISIISFAIVYLLYRNHKKEQTIKLLQEEARTLEEKSAKDHAYREFEKIIYPHQMKRIKEGQRIENTMPSRSEKAVVISFDIQDSSKIGHSEHHDFFVDVFKNCNKAMLAYYDKEHLAANAYMIKEMGDGFLCSVGFPFSCSGNPADQGFALAETFVDIFNSNVRKYFKEEKYYCSIGISYGEISGYFPTIGLKQYDLYGDAIIHATRYESMRKHLFESGISKGNIIILQDLAYNQLSSEYSSEIEKFKLDTFKVRDDSRATELYFKLAKNSLHNHYDDAG